MTLWRISNHSDLAGVGGELSNGRWHTAARGKRIVYLSEHPALALLETLAHLKGNPLLFPDTFQLLRVSVAASLQPQVLDLAGLSSNWRENLTETQAAGNSWLAGKTAVLFAVPSAASPESINYLFNPLHPDARALTIEQSNRVAYDKRLFHI